MVELLDKPMCKKKVKEKQKIIARYKAIKRVDKNGVVYLKCPNCSITVLQTTHFKYPLTLFCPYCDCELYVEKEDTNEV